MLIASVYRSERANDGLVAVSPAWGVVGGFHTQHAGRHEHRDRERDQ